METRIKDIFNKLALENLELVSILPEIEKFKFSDGEGINEVRNYRLKYKYAKPLGSVTGGSTLIEVNSSDEAIEKKILDIQRT